ncbi:LOW QUALITY PROTEIN: uncharacterized protein Dsimw501_GD28966, partial [Drosophila simulans]
VQKGCGVDVHSGGPRCSIRRLLSTLRIKDKPNQLNILSSWKHSLVHKRLHTYSCRNITHTNISNHTHTHSHSHTDRRSSQNSEGKTSSSSMNTNRNRQKFPLATISNCFSHKLELELELKLQ